MSVLTRNLIALTVGAALLAGCAGNGRPSPRALKQIDRALERAPGKAQPSTIVKTELAFARVSREDGQRKPFQQFAAPGAQFHGPDGPVDALTFVAEQMGPDDPGKWSTKSVFMSCDGQTAVSQGRLTEPDGTVGSYVFVWERQPGISTRDDEETGYRFVYFAAAPDDPQPPPRAPAPAPKPGDIVVEALDAVRADIARCAPREDIDLTPLTAPPLPPGMPPEIRKARNSRDATLHWVWTQGEQGALRIGVSLWRKDSWESVLTQDLRLDR